MSDKTGSLSHNEVIKDANPSLAGEIAPTLNDSAVDAFSKDDQQFLKFHGIYQQDDRDVRKQGKKYMFMIRGRTPGGVVSPEVYLTYDRLSEEYGNQTLRVTTRQSFQFHGVVKSGLGPNERHQRFVVRHAGGVWGCKPQCVGAAHTLHHAFDRAGV